MNLALQFGMAVRIKNHSFRSQGKNRDFRGEQKTRQYIGALERFTAFFSAALCVFMFRKSHFCDVPSTDPPAVCKQLNRLHALPFTIRRLQSRSARRAAPTCVSTICNHTFHTLPTLQTSHTIHTFHTLLRQSCVCDAGFVCTVIQDQAAGRGFEIEM